MFIGLLALGIAIAQPSTPKEILETAIEKRKFKNSYQELTMTLFAKNGAQKERSMQIYLQKDEDTLRSYTRFTAPADIKGTQLRVG